MKPTVFILVFLLTGIFTNSKNPSLDNRVETGLETNLISVATKMVEPKTDLARVYLYKFSRIKSELRFSAKRRVTKLT